MTARHRLRPTYEEACAAFDWSTALNALNWSGQSHVALAETIVDRHVDGSGANKLAILWVGADGTERRITFGDLHRQSTQLGSLLRRLGVAKGDRVATVLPRMPATISVFVAALRIGAILVPVFSGFGSEAIAYRLRHSGSKVVFVDYRYRDLIQPIDGLTVITIGDAPSGSRPGDFDGESAFHGDSVTCESAVYNRRDAAAIIYTSGSTGQPKGCVIAANILAAMWPYVHFGLDLHPDSDVFWPTGDPSWGYGLCCYLPALAMGASVLSVESNATPEVCLNTITRFRVSNLATTPTVLRGLMAQGEAIRNAGASVRRISSCGEPLNGEVVTFFRRVWNVTPMDHFGATEFGLPIGNQNAVEMVVKPGSMGLPAPGQMMAVVSDSGERLPPGQVGLIAQRSNDSNFYWLRYWNDEAATALLRHGQWICTGDLAHQDKDGYFWFEGRTDDIIKSSGYRIGPFEIESAILKHGAIAEAAIVGVFDQVRGQAVKAFVVMRPDAIRSSQLENEIIDLVKTTCGHHMAPREIVVVPSLPKTQTGKIQRFLLRNSQSNSEGKL